MTMSYSGSLPTTGLYGSGYGTSTLPLKGVYGASVPQVNPLLVNPTSEVVVEKEVSVNLWKFAPLLLLLFLLPALLVVAFLIPILLVGLCAHFFFLFAWKKSFGNKDDTDKPRPVYMVPYPPSYPPYYPGDPYGNEYARKRRSAGPVQSANQVEELTTAVISALRNQDCIQRLLCEAVDIDEKLSDIWIRAIENNQFEVLKPNRKSSTYCQRYKCSI